MRKRQRSKRPFTADNVRRILSSPVYAYGINLMHAERVVEKVMQLNTQLAQELRDPGTLFSLEELDRRFLDLLRQLEESGQCVRGVDCPTLITKDQWLQAQLTTIQKLSRGEQL
jgi:hypothetical protein